MKTLVVMRHGKAMPPTQDQPDAERSLTEAGVEALEARLPRMLGLLETRGAIAQIWTSPALRARQTAKLLHKALQRDHVLLEKKIELHESLWEQDVDGFLEELRTSDAEFVFAVGHVPFVEDIIEELVGTTPPFSTGALACMEVRLADANAPDTEARQDKARLLWFAQGPVASHWDTLNQLQAAMTRMAEAIEDRREAFFADPDDVETIHRFRTRTRTLRSLVAFVKPWQNAEQNAKTQALLKEIVGYTSLLRELDVLEEEVRENPDASPKLVSLCKKEASLERARVLKALSSKKVSRQFERAMYFAKNVAWRQRYVQHGLPKRVVRERFDTLIESVSAELDTLDLHDAERTHDVRKRAKRARYVAEQYEGVLGPDALTVAKNMNAHQDNLGKVCDARANIRLINDFLRRDLPKSVARELKAMRAQNEAFLRDTLG